MSKAVYLYGQAITRPAVVLAAIGAQESLEAHGAARLGTVMTSPSQERAYDKERTIRARRRNKAEAKLRPEERIVWERWRAAKREGDERAAVVAMLADPPRA